MTRASEGIRRAQALRWAVQVEWLSVGWVMLEALFSLVASRQSGSLALSAFGVDSAIELMSGVVLLARLTAECNAAGPAAGASGASDVTHRADGARDCPQPQHAQTLSQDSGIHMPHANGHGGERMPGWERWASAVVAGCLFVLAGFVAWKSGQAFALRQAPAATPLGLAVTAASGLITPWFALRKRRLGRILGSRALLGDAACSFACAYMAWTVLAGLALQWLTGIWWLDPLAALGILGFVVREAWESADSARTGEVHVHG